jgi:Zn-dependent membrane protease YugP
MMFTHSYASVYGDNAVDVLGNNWVYFIVIIGLTVVALGAQAAVTGTFNKYKQVVNRKGLTARETARKILDENGLEGVMIREVPGQLSDNYNPRTNVVSLSEAVYNSSSLAAIAVAAHECGHAIQHKKGYIPVIARDALVPVTNFASRGWFLICILGIFFGMSRLFLVGAIVFGIVALFHLVTLPVEFDASHRALKILDGKGFLAGDEIPAARKVLFAAAMTYIVSFAMALVQFLRMAALAKRER